eukprot:COSAG01_NODE_2377_length_7801_cov_4.201117_4_plen_132_part_00
MTASRRAARIANEAMCGKGSPQALAVAEKIRALRAQQLQRNDFSELQRKLDSSRYGAETADVGDDARETPRSRGGRPAVRRCAVAVMAMVGHMALMLAVLAFGVMAGRYSAVAPAGHCAPGVSILDAVHCD